MLEAFHSVWNQPYEPVKANLLCLAVELGADIGDAISEQEVRHFNAALYEAQICKLEWLWVFGKRKDQDELARRWRDEGTTPGNVMEALGPYGYEPPVEQQGDIDGLAARGRSP